MADAFTAISVTSGRYIHVYVAFVLLLGTWMSTRGTHSVCGLIGLYTACIPINIRSHCDGQATMNGRSQIVGHFSFNDHLRNGVVTFSSARSEII